MDGKMPSMPIDESIRADTERTFSKPFLILARDALASGGVATPELLVAAMMRAAYALAFKELSRDDAVSAIAGTQKELLTEYAPKPPREMG